MPKNDKSFRIRTSQFTDFIIPQCDYFLVVDRFIESLATTKTVCGAPFLTIREVATNSEKTEFNDALTNAITAVVREMLQIL
jgi:hypothetical protein